MGGCSADASSEDGSEDDSAITTGTGSTTDLALGAYDADDGYLAVSPDPSRKGKELQCHARDPLGTAGFSVVRRRTSR